MTKELRGLRKAYNDLCDLSAVGHHDKVETRKARKKAKQEIKKYGMRRALKVLFFKSHTKCERS